MGSCVSVDKCPESAMGVRFSMVSKAKKLVIPSPSHEKRMSGENKSVTVETLMNGQNPLATVEKQMNSENSLVKSVSPTKTPVSQFGFYSSSPRVPSGDFGCKEEIFFDTQVWLESDCDDDFLSVNGDFTPSRGSTPNHQRSIPGTPQFNRAFSFDKLPTPNPQPSPIVKKKKLADLFKESMEREQIDDDRSTSSDMNNVNGIPTSQGTPYLSGTNSVRSHETTPIKEAKLEKGKRHKAAQCCMPSLVSSLSFNDRNKRMSPGCRNGG